MSYLSRHVNLLQALTQRDRADVINQGINKNGRSEYASEHFYQSIDKFQDKSKYTPELLQGMCLSVSRKRPQVQVADTRQRNS